MADTSFQKTRHGDRDPTRGRTFAVSTAAGAVAWVMLTGAEAGSAVVGVPTVLAAAWAATAAGAGSMAPRAGAAIGFVPFFAVALLQSAWGLARRVLRRDPAFRPGVVAWRLRLSGEGARAAFMNAVSLTPGTLAAGLDGDVLSVHVLDLGEDHGPGLDDLERRVARLYGETLA